MNLVGIKKIRGLFKEKILQMGRRLKFGQEETVQKFQLGVTALVRSCSQLHRFYFLQTRKKCAHEFILPCWLGLGDVLVVWDILKRAECVIVLGKLESSWL